MKINTRDFGLVAVESNDIYDFPLGVYGFEDDTQFALFNKVFDDIPFLYLQSVLNTVPCFLVFEPGDFCPGYSPALSKEDLDSCGADNPNELVFLVIANVSDSIEQIALNMKSPIVLNPKSKIGHQVILQNEDYLVRYQPFLSNGKGEAKCW